MTTVIRVLEAHFILLLCFTGSTRPFNGTVISACDILALISIRSQFNFLLFLIHASFLELFNEMLN